MYPTPLMVVAVAGRYITKSVTHDCWPLRLQTFTNRKTSPPFGRQQIILLGDNGTFVNNLPRVVTWQ